MSAGSFCGAHLHEGVGGDGRGVERSPLLLPKSQLLLLLLALHTLARSRERLLHLGRHGDRGPCGLNGGGFCVAMRKLVLELVGTSGSCWQAAADGLADGLYCLLKDVLHAGAGLAVEELAESSDERAVVIGAPALGRRRQHIFSRRQHYLL